MPRFFLPVLSVVLCFVVGVTGCSAASFTGAPDVSKVRKRGTVVKDNKDNDLNPSGADVGSVSENSSPNSSQKADSVSEGDKTPTASVLPAPAVPITAQAGAGTTPSSVCQLVPQPLLGDGKNCPPGWKWVETIQTGSTEVNSINCGGKQGGYNCTKTDFKYFSAKCCL